MFTGTEILSSAENILDWSCSGWIWEKRDLKTQRSSCLASINSGKPETNHFLTLQIDPNRKLCWPLTVLPFLCTLKPTLAEQPAGITCADGGVGPYYKLWHRLRALARREHLFHHEWEHTELSTSGSSTVRKHKSERRGNSAVKTMWSVLMRSRWWKGYSEIVNAGRQMKNSKESVLIERRPRLIWAERQHQLWCWCI